MFPKYHLYLLCLKIEINLMYLLLQMFQKYHLFRLYLKIQIILKCQLLLKFLRYQQLLKYHLYHLNHFDLKWLINHLYLLKQQKCLKYRLSQNHLKFEKYLKYLKLLLKYLRYHLYRRFQMFQIDLKNLLYLKYQQ